MAEKEKRFCEKCHSTKNVDNFYKTNNLAKYPSGYLNQCKECITMHVDNWDSNTFMWILQECDVPYVPDEWNKLLASYAKDPTTVTGMTIIGRYLSKMKLKQFKDFRWQDTEFLQEKANREKEEAMKRQGFSAAEIAEVIEKGSFPIPTGPLSEPQYTAEPINNMDLPDTSFEDSSISDQLTDEDKLMLRVKWGKSYKPDEWIQLEKLYNEMMESYDIQSAGHIDTLKMICKTSLKANQLLDMGDVDGAQKMVKMYDMLMKSGKFTAAQNKSENDEVVDSIGEIVALCEKEGFIARYYIDKPNDKVDKTIMDMQKYTHDLVTEELGLGNLIENAIQQLQKEKDTNDEILKDEESFEDDLFKYEDVDPITDADFSEFADLEEELSEEDYLSIYDQLKEDDR